ncbi:MAG: hypothetical protein AAFR04_02185 [Pseudomonadota bacterium]
MRTPPFSITPILMTTLGAGALGGAIVGALLGGMGLSHWFWATLCGVLPGFLVNPLRASLEAGMADIAGATPPPFAVNTPACIGLAIASSLIAAYAIVGLADLGVGFLSGTLIGLLSGILVSSVMTLRRTAS